MTGLGGRLRSLPLPAFLGLVGLVAVASGAGGYYAYRTYDYIEHDNEFCFSCHLMQDPYELFAQSAHRGLGCKACHQPTLMERSMMGVTGIVVDPDTISAHARVPNELCADCHINGDPEKWVLVASSAGHRVHFESEDSTLAGLQCVECHQSSLHQFAAADETCAQSGCHTDSDVQLGAMSDLTMHCAACHGFSAPTEDFEAASAAISPDRDTCFSCHAMRVLAEMPENDPHEASCGSCHNPHEQSTPAEAVASCASAGCHDDPESLTPFHEGLDPSIAVDCLYCHQAHDFEIDGSDCTACHQGILDDDPTATPLGGGGAPHGDAVGAASTPGVEGSLSAAARFAAYVHLAESGDGWRHPTSRAQEVTFRHSEHPSVECTACHATTERHGALTVTTVGDCRSCHHTDEADAAEGCATCHIEADSSGDPHAVVRTLALTTGASRSRSLPFEHAPHEGEDCSTCHTEGLALSAADVDCTSCHDEHHEPDVTCRSCHAGAPEGSHAIETAHVTCSGAGCHQDVPFQGLPRTNDVCLVCHQDQVDHRPDGLCSECHALPEIGGAP